MCVGDSVRGKTLYVWGVEDPVWGWGKKTLYVCRGRRPCMGGGEPCILFFR